MKNMKNVLKLKKYQLVWITNKFFVYYIYDRIWINNKNGQRYNNEKNVFKYTGGI